MGEILLYILSALIVGTGIFTIIYGALEGEALVALVGGIATSMIFPAYHQAAKIRKQNLAIRLLEEPLRKAKTSEEAANILNEFFREALIGKPKK